MSVKDMLEDASPSFNNSHSLLSSPQFTLHVYWIEFHFILSLVKGRMSEAVRASKKYSATPKPIYVYIRYVYADTRSFLTEVRRNSELTPKQFDLLWSNFYSIYRVTFWWFSRMRKLLVLMGSFFGEAVLILSQGMRWWKLNEIW